MKTTAELFRNRLLDENPLLVSVLGMAGAVVFTRDIASALTAAVTSLAVLAAATAAAHLYARLVGERGSRVVFFSTATAVTAICALAASALIPFVFDKIGACYPLFPVGSLALVTSRGSGTLRRRELEVLSLTAGYGAVIVIISAIRQLFSLVVPFASSSAAALMIAGVLAALLRVAVYFIKERGTEREEGVIAQPRRRAARAIPLNTADSTAAPETETLPEANAATDEHLSDGDGDGDGDDLDFDFWLDPDADDTDDIDDIYDIDADTEDDGDE